MFRGRPRGQRVHGADGGPQPDGKVRRTAAGDRIPAGTVNCTGELTRTCPLLLPCASDGGGSDARLRNNRNAYTVAAANPSAVLSASLQPFLSIPPVPTARALNATRARTQVCPYSRSPEPRPSPGRQRHPLVGPHPSSRTPDPHTRPLPLDRTPPRSEASPSLTLTPTAAPTDPKWT